MKASPKPKSYASAFAASASSPSSSNNSAAFPSPSASSASSTTAAKTTPAKASSPAPAKASPAPAKSYASAFAAAASAAPAASPSAAPSAAPSTASSAKPAAATASAASDPAPSPKPAAQASPAPAKTWASAFGSVSPPPAAAPTTPAATPAAAPSTPAVAPVQEFKMDELTLFDAVEKLNPKQLSEFLELRPEVLADINTPNQWGWTCLRAAVTLREDNEDSKHVVSRLLEAKADPFIPAAEIKGRLLPVHEAARQAKVKLFHAMVDPNPSLAQIPSNKGLQALHYAAEALCLPIVQHLIEVLKVGVDIKTDEQNTPLHYAGAVMCSNNNKNNANNNANNNNNNNKINNSNNNNNADERKIVIHPVWKYLVQKGADLDARNSMGHSPIGKLFPMSLKRMQAKMAHKRAGGVTASSPMQLLMTVGDSMTEARAQAILDTLNKKSPSEWEPIHFIFHEFNTHTATKA